MAEQAPAATVDATRLFAEDEQARREALDPSRSFLLQAPAGSGKTTVLTCRFLALLAVAAQPEEVLAITFTRKAAAEMRGRVLRALGHASAGDGGEGPEAAPARAALARDAAQGWGLLDNPARLRIQTIDAFCQRLAAQLPVSSRAGGGRELALPADALYRAAARRVLERSMGEAALREPARDLLARLDNDWSRLEHLLELMLANRSHWLPRLLGGEADLAVRVADALQALVSARLRALRARFDAGLLAQAAPLAATTARTLSEADVPPADPAAVQSWLERDDAPGDAPAELPRWRHLARLLLKVDGDWRRSWNKRDGVPTTPASFKQAVAEWAGAVAVDESLRPLLAEVLALPGPGLEAGDGAALAGLSLLLQHAAAELELEFVRRGQVDHVAVAAAARAALSADGKPTDLALRCGEAIRHVLVDEFQDTSLEQFELLRALTAGWTEGDGRTLFAVGDPMQSIYQFREAEVGLFLQARAAGLGGLPLVPLQLRRNFRSAPGVIDWVNEACGRVFPARDDPWLAAIRYLPAMAGKPVTGGQVTVHALASADAAEEAARIAQAALAERAAAPGCSIAVLVPARRHAAPIAAALRAAGLAVRGVDIEPLAERPVVRDLAALVRALLHPADRAAWLALLRAPWCGLSLAQLQAIAEDSEALPWNWLEGMGVVGGERAGTGLADAAADDARARLARVRAALEPACLGSERLLPLAERAERAWLRLGGPATCASDADHADAEAYFQALDAWRPGDEVAGEAADAVAADLYATAAPRPGAVDILTVHGAKGLEWDVVFLPALGRGARRDDRPLLEWLDLPADVQAGGVLLAPLAGVGDEGVRSLASYIAGVKKQRRSLERTRLLYVAATRARCSLHWLGHAPPDGEGVPRPPGGTSLDVLWPVLAPAFEAAAAGSNGTAAQGAPAGGGGAVVPSATPGAAAVAVPSALRLPADWRPTGMPPEVAVERFAVGAAPGAHQAEYSWVGLEARLVGTVVHAELQRLAALPRLPADGSALRAVHYLPRLAELGLQGAAGEAAARRVHAAVAATLADPRGRWLLGEGGGEGHSELRLAGLHEGRLVTISIDRVRTDAQGDRWIIDYKTGTHEGAEVEAFLDNEAVRYAPQLARYRAMASAVWPGRLRTALYFPLLGAFREVEG